jgi:hypothetical protein
VLAHFCGLAEQLVADPERRLVDYRVMDDADGGGYRPGDFPEADLSQKELEDLLLELSQPEVAG